MIDLKNKKGIYIWHLSACEKGSIDAIIEKCLTHGIEYLLIKAGDAARNSQWSKAAAKNIIEKCHSSGMLVGCWNYSKPTTWESEVSFISECVKEGIDFWALDPEQEWEDHPDNKNLAVQFMTKLRSEVGHDFLLMFAPFAIQQYHTKYPYEEFLRGCDIVAGQLYWTEINRKLQDLIPIHDNGWRDFFQKHKIDTFTHTIAPIANTYGKGFPGVQGELTKEDMKSFINHYKDVPISFYSYDAAFPLFWEALKEVAPKIDLKELMFTTVPSDTSGAENAANDSLTKIEQVLSVPATKSGWNNIFQVIIAFLKSIFKIK